MMICTHISLDKRLNAADSPEQGIAYIWLCLWLLIRLGILSKQPWHNHDTQALFTIRIWVHVTHKKSPFYLLYSCHLFLSFNENSSRSLKLVILNKEYKKHITTLHTARFKVNKRLLVKAEHTQKIQKKRVK